ncbi:hypothetical protein AX17_006164 [Amanita inopinata Kibby_2008]|nr:hypothetical protein AX17_006164 [Amanita inopinata Kibby_2008]
MKSTTPARNVNTQRKSRTPLHLSLTLLSGFIIYVGIQSYARLASPGYIVCSKTQRIYTVDESTPNVECIAIQNARITATGSLDSITERRVDFSLYSATFPWIASFLDKLRKPQVKFIPDGAIIIPGLTDAHAHVLENGYMKQLPLISAKSVKDVVELVKQYIEAHPEIRNDRSRWVEGMGWDHMKWPDKTFPVAEDLDGDPILKGRPISLTRTDGHARWVSPTVLRLMGDLPSKVKGGEILRDSAGKPTGVLIDNAMDLVPAPTWTEERMSAYFETTMKEALSSGLTYIQDAMTLLEHIEFFKKKAEDGQLPLRLYLMGNYASDEYWGSKIPRLINYGKHSRLNVRSIKLFTDGALGSWGAAMLEPYSDKPETSGLLRTSPEQLSYLINRFYEDGWQVNVHCIGDKANQVVLDIYENIIEGKDGKPKVNVTEWRPRIEHAQIISLPDLERFGQLGVIASVQPTHSTSQEMWYAEERLGSERIKGAYAYQTLLSSSPNKVLPLGSDFPIEGVNPLLGFYAAVSRLAVDGTSPHGDGGWFPEQKLTRSQALKGMTLDAAYASFSEHELGSLVPGKKADFVVLDRDIMTVPFGEILKTKVVATVVDGDVMYGRL